MLYIYVPNQKTLLGFVRPDGTKLVKFQVLGPRPNNNYVTRNINTVRYSDHNESLHDIYLLFTYETCRNIAV